MLLVLGSTLTLPGLAGFVLAIGLAIDANVLVFERAREEYAENPRAGMKRALQIGFNKAWTAIIDSNVTTLLAAALLFILASGPVKGFGVTLSIGVIASMISALVIARVLTEIGVVLEVRRQAPRDHRPRQQRPGPRLAEQEEPRPDGAPQAVAGHLRCRAGLRAGRHLRHRAQPRPRVHRRPGRRLLHQLSRSPPTRPARSSPRPACPRRSSRSPPRTARTTRSSRSGPARSPTRRATQIQAGLAAEAGDAELLTDNEIAASLGDELRNKALLAFGIALAVQMLYLAIRFKWTFGAAAVIAMFHDVRDRHRCLRLAGQADRRHLPGRGADHHRSVGQRHRGGLRPHPRALVRHQVDRLRRGGQQGRGRDDAAHGQHRPRRDVHPRGAGGASAATRCGTSRSRCCSAW